MKFDIILPTLHRPTLQKAIDSVFAQTHQDFELYIVEENQFNMPYVVSDKRKNWIKIPYNQNDFGAFARNSGIMAGKSEWIAYIDDDDEWLPHHLETHAKIIEDNLDIDMISTAGQSFKMKHKSPRSSKRIKKLGYVNTEDRLTVGMSHTRKLFTDTSGWQPCDNHDHILWHEMLALGGEPVTSDEITYHFMR